MKKVIIGIFLACLLIGQIHAEEPRWQADYPENYTVRKGDTLWDISATFLKNPWMWPEIWHVNTQIANPHLIYPGDIIRLIYLDGQPRLTLTRGDVVKLLPEGRVLSEAEAISTIPLEAINSFLSRSRILDPGILEAAPYMIAGEGNRLIVGAGDSMYARGDFNSNYVNYGVYRQGDTYKDPVTNELLGVQARDIGAGKLRALDEKEGVATLTISRTTEELRVGDRLLPHEERAIESTFFPSGPENKTEAVILAVEGGVSQVGKFDVVIMNRGARESIKPGTVLAVYKSGAEVKDRFKGDTVRLPDERAGLVMIFRAFEKVSLGLVLEAERPLAIGDKLRNP